MKSFYTHDLPAMTTDELHQELNRVFEYECAIEKELANRGDDE